MKLVGVLSWYDEPVWCLTELVTSAARAGMDSLVAVDGAYMLYPGGMAQSPSEQAQAILAACTGNDVEVLLHLPREVWFGNEIEKRTFSFDLAHRVMTPGDDWMWILDGDEKITEANGLREALEQTDLEAASVWMDEVHDGSREGQIPFRKLFRAQESGIRCVNNHFTLESGDGRLLYEGFQTPSEHLEECEHLAMVRFDHRGGRSEARRYAAQVYYDRRKERKIELVPG